MLRPITLELDCIKASITASEKSCFYELRKGSFEFYYIVSTPLPYFILLSSADDFIPVRIYTVLHS